MGGTYAGLAPRHPPWFRAPARAARRPARCSRWGLQAVPAIAPSAIRHLICWGVRAETGAIPAIGVFAAAALRAAVPAGGRPSSPGGGSKPSPPWRAIGSTPSRAHPRCRRPVAAALDGNRWEVGVRYPTPRHGDQCPRFTRNRHPRQQVAPPWGALRAVSMRNTDQLDKTKEVTDLGITATVPTGAPHLRRRGTPTAVCGTRWLRRQASAFRPIVTAPSRRSPSPLPGRISSPVF